MGAVALNEYLASDALSEDQILQTLSTREWRLYNLPAVVKREIEQVVERRLRLSA
jgi:hypothetical protein